MEKKKKWVLLSLSIPAFLLIFIFMIVPLGNAVRVSFFKWNGYSQEMKFIGLENYISLFSDKAKIQNFHMSGKKFIRCFFVLSPKATDICNILIINTIWQYPTFFEAEGRF